MYIACNTLFSCVCNNLLIFMGIDDESGLFEEPALCEEEEEGEGEGEKSVGWGVGDTSILATSSTMLLDAIWTIALEELLLELEAMSGPDDAAEEEEEEEDEEVAPVEVVLCESTEADGLPRLLEND